jgi:hypothetical protein
MLNVSCHSIQGTHNYLTSTVQFTHNYRESSLVQECGARSQATGEASIAAHPVHIPSKCHLKNL